MLPITSYYNTYIKSGSLGLSGDAFHLLLQLPDESALSAVLHSVVLFARMKPHQKGQVMDLLGTKGLHLLHAGAPRHIRGVLPMSQCFVTQQTQMNGCSSQPM